MNDQEFDKAMRERARTEDFRLPEDYPGRVFAACASLKETTGRVRKKRSLTHWAAGVAAALAVFVNYARTVRKQFGGLSGDLAGWFLQRAEFWMLAALVLCQYGERLL